MKTCDVLVIGGGIAGTAAAYEMSSSARVVVLEREPWPGYHATGRSAASFTENYGNTVIRRLARASRQFLESPPDGFAEHALLAPRGMLTIGREDQRERLDTALARAQGLVPEIHAIASADALDLVPALRPEAVAAAMLEPACMDLDVHGLAQGYLKSLKARGGAIVTDAGVYALGRRDGLWEVETAAGRFSAPLVVNAAGAWADEVAAIAGMPAVGLVPKRRTAFTFDPPPGMAVAEWPLVCDVDDAFYFKPDAGRILASPADATPSPPCDAQPEELDLAVGVARIEEATTMAVPRIAHKWAGLRTFAPDGSPVVGFDEAARDFFWLAGQGGYGIKTAPALARAAASLIFGGNLPDDLAALGIERQDLAPARLGRLKAS